MTRLILSVLTLVFVCVQGPREAQAHHAFAADYQAGNEGTIEGTVKEVMFKNPHARYYLEVDDGAGGSELWDLETMNLMMLGRMGWKKDTIKVGDQISVTGILGRNNTRRMSIVTVTLPGGRVISPVRSLTTTNAELNKSARADSKRAFHSVASAISPGAYELDETHAYLSFSYSHMGLSNPQLQFTDFDAQLMLDGNDMAASSVTLAIDAASIDSGVAELDRELRGEDFFNVAAHPQMVFASTAYRESSANSGRLDGDLTVMGVTRPVSLDVTINSAAMNRMVRKEMIGFSVRGSLRRSDFGLTAFDQFVSDELVINGQLEFVRAN